MALHKSLWGSDPEDEKHALYPLRHRVVGSISREDIDTALKKIPKPVRREKTRLLLSTLFAHAITAHGITTNPAKKLERPRTRTEKMASKPQGEKTPPPLLDRRRTRPPGRRRSFSLRDARSFVRPCGAAPR